MKLAKVQFKRLVELEKKIRVNEYPNCLTFARFAEVAQKTVQRDIDYLRDQLGAPIDYDKVKKGYYYTDRNWFLPSMVLTEGSLVALLIASRTLEQYKGSPIAKELEKIFEKIDALLPERITIRPELVSDKFTFSSPPSKPIDEKAWIIVTRGVLYQTAVRIKYRSFESDVAKESIIYPYHIANLQGEWYVFAVRSGEDMIRQFSMARIKAATLTEETFKPPSDFDAKKLLSNTFGRYAAGDELFRVRLLFDKEVAGWITEREWHPSQKILRRKNGQLELSFDAKGLFEVHRWVLAWGGCVKVLAPKVLREKVRTQIRLMAKKY